MFGVLEESKIALILACLSSQRAHASKVRLDIQWQRMRTKAKVSSPNYRIIQLWHKEGECERASSDYTFIPEKHTVRQRSIIN